MQTPLYDDHAALGARIVQFAGWQMPLQYAGIIAEHHHTRSAASLFDVCHMTEFRVVGPGAADALRRAVACRVKDLRFGHCRYGFLLNERGGIIDDLVCYRLGEEEYMIVANAARRSADAATLQERMAGAVTFEDTSDGTGKLDLQGPQSLKALNAVSDGSPGALPYYGCTRMRVAGIDTLVSRTGYTGELGYELYVPIEQVGDLWGALLDIEFVKPAGLGARDTLRLEMGLPLYGHELTEEVTPTMAGYGWTMPLEGGFIGAEGLERRREEAVQTWLVGVEFEGRRAVRAGDPLFALDKSVGRVTSGSFAPSLGCAVAMGYVPGQFAPAGTDMESEARGTRIAGKVVERPFYRHGSARANTSS